VRNKPSRCGHPTHCRFGVEVREVSEASATRRAKSIPRHARPRERLNPAVRQTLGPLGPRPNPDLLHARQSPQIVDVPVSALLVPEVPSQAGRQIAFRRSDIHVPAGREPTTPQSPRDYPAWLTDAKDQRIDSTIVVVANHVPLQDRFARRPPELSWRCVIAPHPAYCLALLARSAALRETTLLFLGQICNSRMSPSWTT
jgi:hypothetical protein